MDVKEKNTIIIEPGKTTATHTSSGNFSANR
jgi:hypothetical protein